jgi:hypothetical protein
VLPAPLLLAISSKPHGRVAIIVGAGCSLEAPTCIPLAKDVAVEAHRRLRADGVLNDRDCANPEDLSCVADAVYAKTGQQTPLVERMVPPKFRTAEPNEGYLLAAALLREEAILCLMTLNFDCAIATALTQVGAGDEIALINGPTDHTQVGLINVIFLHRNAWSPPEEWLLRTTVLDSWQGRWQEIVANRVLSSPVTVFAGLGSPSGVLIETTRKIRTAIPNGTNVYQVDPGNREASRFFADLQILPEAYLQMPWGQFMKELSDRVLQEHRDELEHQCQVRIHTEQLENENTETICTRLTGLGLIAVGRLRARWLLEPTGYFPHVDMELSWIADLVLAIALIERKTGTQAVFHDDGIVELHRGGTIASALILAHGRGSKRWLSMEPVLHGLAGKHERRYSRQLSTVVAGVQGQQRPEVSPPTNIVPTEDPSSILPKAPVSTIVDVEELRANEATIARLVPHEQ